MDILCQTFPVRKLIATLCLTIALLLGGSGCSQNYWVMIEMSMVVLDPQVTNGVSKNNNASDHGNTNRLVIPFDLSAAQNPARERVRKKYKGC
jgi:hypothetical protein